MKRILSLILALVLVATLFPALPIEAEAKTGGKLIAITFDDGPHSRYTEQLLDGLAERGVKATFFMLGENAERNRDVVLRAYEEGHEIACHTWDHPDLTGCYDSKVVAQIEDTLEELDRACGDEADYLVRPPYGSTNARVRALINNPLIYWSVDSEDWSLLNTEKVRKKIVADSYDGCIILCHDIHKTTIPAALQAIDDLMDLGYEFVTVSELYRRRGRELVDHELHYNSKKNGIDYGPIPAPEISFEGDPKGVNTVTLSCSDPDVPLYYTLDGSYPNQDANQYTGPFTVPYGTEVTAVAAYKLNGSRSELTKAVADDIRVVAPTIKLDSTGAVVMTTPTIDGEIFFTIDNTAADGDSLLYTGPEYIAGGCFLRAVTVHETAGVSTETMAYLSEAGELYYDMYEGQWFYEAMDWAHSLGILNGTAPYTMSPGGVVTRGMLVTLLYRFSGDSLESEWERTNTFKDVNQKAYYAEAIEWAYRNNIVDGYGTYAFGPDDDVTRQQMCKIVAAFLNWLGTPLAQGESCEGVFGDYDEIAGWALESVEAMVSAGLIKGVGSDMKPNDGANRAQFCVLLMRLAEYIDNYVPVEPEEPTEPSEPTDPTEPEEPTDPSEPTDPTDPEPTEPEPTEPEHVHEWKVNKMRGTDPTKGDVTIDVGGTTTVKLVCQTKGCYEVPEVEWTADPDGVVLVEGFVVTGLTGGMKTTLYTEFEGVEYQCIVRVRQDTTVTEPTDPTEPEPTDPEPTDPTEPEPTEPDPTDPTDPEEPDHEHIWKLNKSTGDSLTEGDVSIDVGETFTLRILCRVKDCTESAPIEWTPSREGVVRINGFRITGLTAGKNTTLSAEWEGVTYSCIVRVRKSTSDLPGIALPM